MLSKVIKFDAISKSETVEEINFIEEPISVDKQRFLIRERRLTECFPVVNRGILWHNMLSEAQVSELQTWYQAWLDAPQTLIIPDKPIWLE